MAEEASSPSPSPSPSSNTDPSPTEHKPYVLLLHGLGDSGASFVQFGEDFFRGFDYDVPDAPKRSISGNGGAVMRGWADLSHFPVRPTCRLDDGWLSSILRVHALLEEAMKDGRPPSHCFIFGFSQGAALAVAAMRTFPHVLGGVIALSGWDCKAHSGEKPLILEDRGCKTPLFIHHGEEDRVVLPSCSEELKKAFSDAEYVTTPGAIHSVPPSVMVLAKAWLTKRLEGEVSRATTK